MESVASRMEVKRMACRCKGYGCTDSNHRILGERRPGKFFLAGKAAARDRNLSWIAEGILTYLLSLHPHTKITVGNLIELKRAGRSATRSAIHQLEQYGYLFRRRTQDSHGRFDYVVEVYASPDLNPRHLTKKVECSRLRKSESGEPDAILPRADSPPAGTRIPVGRPKTVHLPNGRLLVTGHITDHKIERRENEELLDETNDHVRYLDEHQNGQTHTHRDVVTDRTIAKDAQGGVCAYAPINKEYEPNPWHIEPYSHTDVFKYINRLIKQGRRIHTPEGLVNKILKEKDPHTYTQIKGVLEEILREEQTERQRQDCDMRERAKYEADLRARIKQFQAKQPQAEERETERELEDARARESARQTLEAQSAAHG